jgi:hypothetical protein
LFDVTSRNLEGATAQTTLSGLYSGPTELMLGTLSGGTALEVADATAMPLSATFSLSIGRGTTAVASTTASSVHLKQRVLAAVQTGSLIGDTSLDLVSLLGSGVAGDVPQAINYRIIVDRGGANEEVVYVRAVNPVGAILTVDAMTVAHSAAETVELISDVIVVSSLTDVHDGRISYTQRVNKWPIYDWGVHPTTITPVYDSLSIVSNAGFASTEGTVVLNTGGSKEISSTVATAITPSDVTLVLASTASFPVSYPYEIIVEVGGFLEERAQVTLNTTGSNTLTINGASMGFKNAHPSGVKVQLVTSDSQILPYTSSAATSLGFSGGIMLNSTHRPAETVIRSSSLNSPRDQGYDFPLRMPSELITRLQYIIDLIRAAGIQVKIIESR